MANKALSVILSVLVFVQTLLPMSIGAKGDGGLTEADLTSVSDYVNYVQEYGAPAMDTASFLDFLKPVGTIHRILHGKIFSEEEEAAVNVELDENIAAMTDYIAENTGLDIGDFLNVMPNFGTPVGEMLMNTLQIDTVSLRQKIYEVGDKARSEGYTSLATMIYVFAMFFTVAESVKIYGVPSETDPDELVVMMDVTYRDGATETVDPDIVINTVTGHAYNDEGTGLAGSGFEMDIYDLTLYTIVNSWQRKFGFSLGYDLFSDINPIFNYNTRRFKFDYAGKEWMIQVWKGNYALITNGGEIGVYNRAPGSRGTFYNAAADEDMLTFSMQIYHGDQLLVARGPETTWWLTAFKITRTIYLPETMTMHFSVTLKDADMLAAFTAAIDAETAHDVTYTVDGLTVNGIW